ncbi:hypothetical protein ACOJQI_08560 [Bacillus salacetis]|uniref:hypothetical protein n=1 Tax=Bacillus salacetis TaxID=2315464 RepID=UPI003B9F311A
MKKLSCALGLSLFLLAGCGTAEESTEANPAEAEAVKEVQQENYETASHETKVNGNTESNDQMTKEKAADVLSQYKDTFMEVINAGPELEEYESKEEIIQHFSTIMTPEYAESLADTYIREENGSLSVVATETPLWLREDQSYTLTEVSEEEYEVIQHINNQLRGRKEVTFTLVMEDDTWVVGKVETRNAEQEDKYKAGSDDRVEGDMNHK